MGAKFKIFCVLIGSASSMATMAADAGNDPSKARLDWSQLSSDQQKSLKAKTLQVKQVPVLTRVSHVYQDGTRKSVSIEGSGAEATFRMEGSPAGLRYAGRAIIQTKSAQTFASVNVILAAYGLTAIRPVDEAGLIWSVQSKPGLEGIEALNRLYESGIVAKANPDWQRNLVTK